MGINLIIKIIIDILIHNGDLIQLIRMLFAVTLFQHSKGKRTLHPQDRYGAND
jgi:hypothetical protein